LKTDLQISREKVRRRSLDTALWRVGALSAALGLGGSLAGPALGGQAFICAGYAAGAGFIGGLVWMGVELWPKWFKLPKGEGE
jgi:hypothetical protein